MCYGAEQIHSEQCWPSVGGLCRFLTKVSSFLAFWLGLKGVRHYIIHGYRAGQVAVVNVRGG